MRGYLSHEKTSPANLEPQARTPPRISCAHADARRALGAETSSTKRTPPAHRRLSAAPKAARLATPPDIRAVFRQGTVTRHGPLTVWAVRTAGNRRRACIVIRSTAQRLKSHDRQRVRRQLREIVRRQQHTLIASVDLVVMLTRTPAHAPTFHELQTAFITACANQHLYNVSASLRSVGTNARWRLSGRRPAGSRHLAHIM